MPSPVSADTLFDLSHTLAAPLFAEVRYPWEILPAIPDFVRSLTALLPLEEYRELAPDVLCHRSATVAPSAVILGPAVIGPHCELRHNARLRGGVLLGEGCCVGNACEVKNSILFDGAAAPHYNYVGDSVLGYGVRLGAGAIAQNLRPDRAAVTVHTALGDIPTGLRMLGAMVGDLAEIGCQSVLCPGAIVGRRARVFALSLVQGEIAAGAVLQGEESHGACKVRV